MTIPLNFEFKISVYRFRGNCNSLYVDVMSNVYSPPECIYSIKLTQLESIENDLNGGRFAHYSSQCNGIGLIYKIKTNLGSWFEDRLSWISQNVHNEWSFDVEMPTVNDCIFTWTFIDMTEAILFKLAF